MGSSIISGLEVVKQRAPNFDGFMICTVDQPFINASFLNELLNSFIPGQKQIIASQSNGLECQQYSIKHILMKYRI